MRPRRLLEVGGLAGGVEVEEKLRIGEEVGEEQVDVYGEYLVHDDAARVGGGANRHALAPVESNGKTSFGVFTSKFL